MAREITVNSEQRLYVIPCGDSGYTCLGFDVCADRCRKLAAWLICNKAVEQFRDMLNKTTAPIGSIEKYREYEELLQAAKTVCEQRGIRCDIELTPQLSGLEGKRVEVIDSYGEKRRFQVGRSTGWMPCHLEIARRNSSGGPAVTGAPFQSVKVIS